MANRIHLPLSAAGRTNLIEFLAHGGVGSNRSGTPDLELVRQAEPLIAFLATQPLTLNGLKEAKYPMMTKYFGKMFTRQVIDARNYDPRHPYNSQGEPEYALFPVAFRHGHLWWLFYLDADKNVNGLMLLNNDERPKPTD